MPHMLAQEHMSYVDALRYGTALTQATIQAAHTAIGSTPAVLVLTYTGTGVWSITSNLSVPSNVIWLIPQGVTVNVASGAALAVGLVMAWQNNWKTGPGVITKSTVATPMEITNLVCTTFVQSNSGGGFAWELNAAPADNTGIDMFVGLNNTTGIQISRNKSNANSCWQFITINNVDLQFTRPGAGAQIVINNTGLMVGSNVSPQHLIQAAGDDVAKPTAGGWLASGSNARFKKDIVAFPDGLAQVRQLLPRWYEFTGEMNLPTGQRCLGLIAEEVEPVAPYMLHPYQAEWGPEEARQTAMVHALDMTPVTYMLVNAVKELAERLEHLEGVTGVDSAEGHAPARRKRIP